MTCSHCGQTLSDGLSSCPGCGKTQSLDRPISKGQRVGRVARVLGGVFSYFLEGLLVLGIVTVFYSAFLVVLFSLFPSQGEGANWIRQAVMELPGSFSGDGRIQMVSARGSGGPDDLNPDSNLGRGEPTAAFLTFKKNDVRTRRADQIYWGGADLNMALRDQDAIQTLKQSRAVITFNPENYLDLEENSMVVIKRIENDPLLKERRSFLVVVEGTLRGRIETSESQEAKVQVATPAGLAQISSKKSKNGMAEFALKVNPDKTTQLTVFQGEATITSMGKTVVVNQNEMTRVVPEMPPSEPAAIPDSIALRKPSPDSVYYYREFPKQIDFEWDKGSAGERYHFQISRDPLFRDRLVDEVTDQPAFTFGNLRDGRFYWRVSLLTAKGLEGTPSEVRAIRSVQDTTPPELTVASPEGNRVVAAPRVLVSGRSEKGSRVFINGDPVSSLPDGGFSVPTRLKEGVNIIVVEAVDQAGNSSYQTRTIHRKR